MSNLYLENWRKELEFNPADNFLREGIRHFDPREIPKLRWGYYSRWERRVEPCQAAILFFSGMYTGIEEYAKDYARTHNNCLCISHDKIFDMVVNQQAINNLDVANEATVEKMGEKIEWAKEHGYDIILDGYYVDIRERAPLVNTLNELGFDVIILVKMHPERYLEGTTRGMALNTVIRGKLIKELVAEKVEFTNELNLKLLDDSITPFCERHNLSSLDLYRQYGPTEQYSDYVRIFTETSIKKNEVYGFYDQLKSRIAYCGAKYAFKI